MVEAGGVEFAEVGHHAGFVHEGVGGEVGSVGEGDFSLVVRGGFPDVAEVAGKFFVLVVGEVLGGEMGVEPALRQVGGEEAEELEGILHEKVILVGTREESWEG